MLLLLYCTRVLVFKQPGLETNNNTKWSNSEEILLKSREKGQENLHSMERSPIDESKEGKHLFAFKFN